MPGAPDTGAKGAYEHSRLDELESRPTINLFELWENGSHVLKLVAGRNYCFPTSLVVPCTWIQSPKSLSLRDVVRDVARHEGGSTTRDQFTHITLESGIHFPLQPNRSPGSTVSDILTYWWGVTLCPPEWNDISQAESVVFAMRAAAIREMTTNSKVQNLSMEMILEFDGLRTMESTPHSNTQGDPDDIKARNFG